MVKIKKLSTFYLSVFSYLEGENNTMSKSKIKRNLFFNSLGLERSYKPSYIVRNPNLNFDKNLEMAVGYQIANSKDFKFLQIGAFDGVKNDPLNQLIRQFNLSGIVVEPQKEAFERLKENYSDVDRLILKNVAISKTDETRPFYTSKSRSTQVASFDRQHLIKRNVPEEDILEIHLKCLSVSTLLKNCAFDNIDLIQIDTEGFDYEILKSINFNEITPSIIRYEHEHLSKEDYNDSVEMLAGYGYQFIVERRDILAIKL